MPRRGLFEEVGVAREAGAVLALQNHFVVDHPGLIAVELDVPFGIIEGDFDRPVIVLDGDLADAALNAFLNGLPQWVGRIHAAHWSSEANENVSILVGATA